MMGTATLYARALAPAIPGASKLPFVGGAGGEIPDVEQRLDDHAVDREHLAAYSKLCGFRLSGVLPPTYPNVLAFPLHMAVITDRRFPFGALGLVHVSNRIAQHRPIAADEPLDLRVTPTPLRPHPKGRTFSLRTEASIRGEVVWEGESTMLKRSSNSGSGADAADGRGVPTGNSGSAPQAGPPERRPRTDQEPPTPSATWRLPADLGRRYAGVSGDINPIHLYDVTAKLFGFDRAIVHGLWTKARALAALEGRLPDAYAVDVQFRKPVLLPASVSFGFADDGDGPTRFTVQDARTGTPHLAGTVTPNERSAR